MPKYTKIRVCFEMTLSPKKFQEVLQIRPF